MVRKKFPFSGIIRSIKLVIFAGILACVALPDAAFAQTPTAGSNFLDSLASEVIAMLVGILGLGVSALIAWLRKRGIPVTSEQEAMFRQIVTARFQQLAKESWTNMREHPERLEEYWKDLSKGRIPKEFADNLSVVLPDMVDKLMYRHH